MQRWLDSSSSPSLMLKLRSQHQNAICKIFDRSMIQTHLHLHILVNCVNLVSNRKEKCTLHLVPIMDELPMYSLVSSSDSVPKNLQNSVLIHSRNPYKTYHAHFLQMTILAFDHLVQDLLDDIFLHTTSLELCAPSLVDVLGKNAIRILSLLPSSPSRKYTQVLGNFHNPKFLCCCPDWETLRSPLLCQPSRPYWHSVALTSYF